jgi:ribose transport system permease protein
MRIRELGIIIAIVIACMVFGVINPVFLTPGNFAVILRACAFTGVMAIGIGFLLMSGMIDISVGAIAGLAAIVTSYIIVKLGYPVWQGYVAGLLVGGIAGWLNSQITLRLGVPAFLVTIGTMYIYRGLALFISNGFTIYPLPTSVEMFGTGTPFGLSWHFLIFVTLVLLGQFLLSETVWGLTVKATGSDRETAFNTEVNVDRVNTQTFILCGVLAALSGLLLMSRIITGQANIGLGWELNAITAAAIGGVSLFGYEGSIIGVFLGVLLIQILQNGLVVIGGSPYLQSVEVGIVLVITAVFDVQQRRRLAR